MEHTEPPQEESVRTWFFRGVRTAFIILLMLILLVTVKAKNIVDQTDLDGKDFVCLKEGYYCGDGVCEEDHYVGYLYYTDQYTEEDAMEMAGFTKIGENRYSNGEFAKVCWSCSYKNGYILRYEITGHD
ncbi:hypothetical protein [Ruminococcus sp.]|uniref:hypothetical protein n=1 Tax=Ruminococcus sp. TaxID=41978 RepID=UPI0025E874F8|nr:hypothetical protein [Ruminococcus sp.]